jgi:hypothetical protein
MTIAKRPVYFPPALVSFAPEESLAVVLPRGQIGRRNTTIYYF